MANEKSNNTRHNDKHDTKYLSTDLTLSSIQSILRYHNYPHEHECKIHKHSARKLSPQEQLQSFQSSLCYTTMQQNIGLIPIEDLQDVSWKWVISNTSADTNHKTSEKNKNNGTTMKSFSLFECPSFGSSSTGLQIPPNIRDILDESDTHKLLITCSSVKIEDIILGFNTTQDEVKELGDLLFQQLLQNHPMDDCTNKTASSFLQVHLNWMEQCTQQAECHSFSFVLLRNVLLYVHYISSFTTTATTTTSSSSSRNEITKEYYTFVVQQLMNMLRMQFQLWNDTSTFQTPWLETVYILLMTFQLEHDISTDFHKAWVECETTMFENMLEKIMACISSFANVLFVCKDTDFIRYLVRTTTEPEKGVHARQILKTIVLQSSVWTFPFPMEDESTMLSTTSKRISLEALPSIESRLRQRYSMMEDMTKNSTTFATSPGAPLQIVSLLQPFLLPYEWRENIGLFVHVFESCSKDMTLLEHVLTLIFSKNEQAMDRKRLKSWFDTSAINPSDKVSKQQDVHSWIEKMLMQM